MEGEWSCYGGCYFNGRENGHVTEVVTSKEGEWSCYRGDHLNRGRMVTLQRWYLMQGEWSCYGGRQYNGGSKVMLRRWPF